MPIDIKRSGKDANNTIVQLHTKCPVCPSSDAYVVYEDGHGYCFSCNYLYLPNRREEDLSEASYQYLDYRGLKANTYQRFGVLHKVDGEGKPISIGFPYSFKATKVRRLEDKTFYWVGQHKPGLFGCDKFEPGTHKYVCITEGELDALSIWQTTGVPAVSVQSAASAVSDVAASRPWFDSYERVYLAFDSDVRGQEALSRVAKLFDYTRVYHVKFNTRKDANEYLQAGEADELRSIFFAARKYLPETLVSSFEDFKTILSYSAPVSVDYPWQTLTDFTGGIRRGESVLITAQEGVGKTELMHNILYHLLKETEDNVGAIFLEEPKRKLLQAVAGLELGCRLHLEQGPRSDSDILAAIEKVVKKDDRLHVYSHFGSDDPDVLLDTIRFMVSGRQCNYILLDHVSMVVSGLAGEDERRALDYIVTRLEMMVKELNFALIFVSHVNDAGLTRGSRYIRKIADVCINLERDFLNPDPLISCLLHLILTKPSRHTGRAGYVCCLVLDTSTGKYHERCEETIRDAYPGGVHSDVQGSEAVFH